LNKPSNHTTENKSARPFNARALTEGARNPPAPAGKEQNWIQTVPGKGWNTQLRLCGPLEPWFNKTWGPKKSNRTPDRSGKPIAMPEKIGSRLKASCQIAKMRELGISPSFLIGHVRWWGKAFRDSILGPERTRFYDPCASALKGGLRISLHSGWNVTPL